MCIILYMYAYVRCALFKRGDPIVMKFCLLFRMTEEFFETGSICPKSVTPFYFVLILTVLNEASH